MQKHLFLIFGITFLIVSCGRPKKPMQNCEPIAKYSEEKEIEPIKRRNRW